MRVLSLFLFVAGASAMNPFEVHTKVQTAHKHLLDLAKSQVESVHEYHRRHFKTLEVPAACEAAITAMETAGTNCPFTDVLTPGEDSTATQAKFEAFCTSACLTALETAITTVGTACMGTDASAAIGTSVADILDPFKKFCIKEGTQYCFGDYLDAFGVGGPSATAGLTEANLDAMCTPCTTKILDVLLTEDVDNHAAIAGMEMACLKDGDKYCVLQLDAASAGMDTGDMGAICEPCFVKYMTAAAALGGTDVADAMGDTMTIMIPLLCEKVDGVTCATKMNSMPQDDSGDACEPGFAAGTCPAGCKDFLGVMGGVLGCCTGNIMEMFKLMAAAGGDVEGPTPEQIKALFNNCGRPDLLNICSAKQLKVKKTIKNIQKGFAMSKAAELKAAIKKDIVAKCAEAEANVMVGDIEAGTDGTVSVEITVIPALQPLDGLSTCLKAQDDTWPTVSTVVPATGRQNMAQALETDGSEVTEEDTPRAKAASDIGSAPQLSLAGSVLATLVAMFVLH